MTSRPARLVVAGLLAGALLSPAAVTAASAHDSLVAADPAPDSSVATLGQVQLTFSADPIGWDGADLIRVIGPDGRYYETGCPDLAGPDVTVPVAAGAAGEYTVEWRIVSSDGHPVSGDYTFTYEPDASAETAAGAAEPACGSPPSSDARSASEASADPGLGIGLGIGGLLAVALALTVWLLVRRPRVED